MDRDGTRKTPVGHNTSLYWRWKSFFIEIYSYFSFSFVHPLLEKGDAQKLRKTSAIEFLPRYEPIQNLAKDFQTIYNSLKIYYSPEEVAKSNLVIRALLRQHRPAFVKHLSWAFLDSLMRIISPIFLRYFLIWLQDHRNHNSQYYEGWIWGLLLCLCPALLTFIHHRFFWEGHFIGYKIRMSMIAAVHEKLLKLNTASLAEITTGHVVNLVSNDVQRFDNASAFGVYLIYAPIETLATLLIAASILGIWPAIGGFSCIILLVPLQCFITRYVVKLREKTTEVTDKRINFMGEMIAGSLAVKMLGWEKPLLHKVEMIRNKEHKFLTRMSCIDGNIAALYGYIQTIMICVSLIVHRYTEGSLNVPDVFFVISLYGITRLSMAFYFVSGLQHLSEAIVSTKRLDRFFKLPESTAISKLEYDSDKVGEIVLKNEYYGWQRMQENDTKQNKKTHSCCKLSQKLPKETKSKEINFERKKQIHTTLKDLVLQIKSGELVGIVGSVGSGKSSLLAALLNEMVNLTVDDNFTHISGQVAYCAQVPWILEDTVRANITFGKEFQLEHYNKVVISCGLDEDFDQLTCGDATQLGERGVNLSGGQKARIAVARAAYSNADINLLDDPLSAVDSKVGKILFNRCIGNGDTSMMKSSTRLLVTHQKQFLSSCDRIILLTNGEIEHIGTWNELKHHPMIYIVDTPITASEDLTNGEIEHIGTWNELEHHPMIHIVDTPITASDDLTNALLQDTIPTTRVLQKNNLSTSITVQDDCDEEEEEEEEEEKESANDIDSAKKHTNLQQLVQTEHKELGHVSLRVYKEYISFIGIFSLALCLLLLLCNRILYVGVEGWVGIWAMSNDETQERVYWIYGLVALTFGTVITISLAAFLFFVLMIRGSTLIHLQMAKRVLYSPLHFFHANPTGRILNRFSKDMGIQDDELPPIILDILMGATEVIGTFVLIFIALPYALLLFPFFVVFFLRIRKRYSMTSREIKRFDGITRSPVYEMFTASIKGLATIRAFGHQERFHNSFLNALELNGSWWTAFLATSRWVAFRMDLISTCVCVVSVVLALLLSKTVSEEVLGLALTYVISMGIDVQWLLRQTAEFENAMTAVERNLEYTRLEQEENQQNKISSNEIEIPEAWPMQGTVEFKSVTASYQPGLDPVLKNVSFNIPGGCSVGIVGRTGSGKSSLLLTLFRLIDINKGQILIDGIDIRSITIDKLRKQMAIIPQDPVLFEGTLRSNLDPFNQFSEARIWKMISRVQLEDTIKAFGGLDAIITESGSNLSVGQRQLVCLARALLADCKIFALDEATANVDGRTDGLIQEFLNTQIHQNDKTLLIIAHRINTVLNCDLLLVLENGSCVEFGAPQALLTNPEGLFRRMVDASSN